MSHTPGPWKNGNKTEYGTYAPNTIFSASGPAIAFSYGIPLHVTLEEISSDKRWSEGLSNALLIAAAPDLLAAAKAFVEWADDCWGSWAINSEATPEARAEYEAAKAAIAKAEGHAA